jgi:hypothetical protein
MEFSSVLVFSAKHLKFATNNKTGVTKGSASYICGAKWCQQHLFLLNTTLNTRGLPFDTSHRNFGIPLWFVLFSDFQTKEAEGQVRYCSRGIKIFPCAV